jgi:hypothetical protein
MRDQDILVTSRWYGNGDLNFATILPILGAPWPSIGNAETLTLIGQLLDELPTAGSDAPEWNTAMKIAAAHHKELPSTILAAPVYNGRYGKWSFKVELCDGASRTKLELYVGPEDDASVRMARVINNNDSGRATSSAEQIGEGLNKAGIVFNA